MRTNTPVYLDHAASTPPAPEVVDAMLPWLTQAHANPSAVHRHGQAAHRAVELARESVAELVGAQADEIVFTSGATESNNLALQGFVGQSYHLAALAASSIEHKSITAVASALAERGVRVLDLPVNRTGTVDLGALPSIMDLQRTRERRLLAIGHANNELGTIQPIAEVAHLAATAGWFLHVDGAQSVGKVPVDVSELGISSMSISGHKLAGPAGIGALYVSPGLREHLLPVQFGGGQETGLRPGTVPLFLVVGMGAAARLAMLSHREVARSRDNCEAALLDMLRQYEVSFERLGDIQAHLPGHLCLRLHGVDGAELMMRVAEQISISIGSACSAGQIGPSHVMRGIGLNDREAGEVVRISFGPTSTIRDAQLAASAIANGIQRARA